MCPTEADRWSNNGHLSCQQLTRDGRVRAPCLLLRAFETNHKISTRYMTSFNSRDFLINQVLTLNNASIKLSFKKQYQLIQMYKFYTFSHIYHALQHKGQ